MIHYPKPQPKIWQVRLMSAAVIGASKNTYFSYLNDGGGRTNPIPFESYVRNISLTPRYDEMSSWSAGSLTITGTSTIGTFADYTINVPFNSDLIINNGTLFRKHISLNLPENAYKIDANGFLHLNIISDSSFNAPSSRWFATITLGSFSR